MTKQEQIEEMTKITCQMYRRDQEKKCAGVQECDMKCLQYQRCEALYNTGYHKPEWISVEDRLPEVEWGTESEAVLYITKQGFMYTGYYGCGGIFHDRYFREYKNSTEGCDISNVTHWMPLPSPPTEREN